MHLYHVDWGSQPAYRRTLAEAHKLAKEKTAVDKSTRSEVRITLKDYPNGHDVFAGLFNGVLPEPRAELRQWWMNRRGALRELPEVGGKPPIL